MARPREREMPGRRANRREGEPRQREERFQRLVELSPDAILLHCDGRIAYANPAAAALLGARSAEELLATPLAAIVPAGRSLDPAAPARFVEQRLLRLDGSEVDVEVAAIPTRHDGRAAVEVVARDLTSRKALEEQLRQSQKLEAVGRLAGGIAHDFNNLLTVMLCCSQMLLEEVAEESPLREDLEEIQKTAQKAAALTGQLLAFSRRRAAQLRVVNLNSLLADMDRMLRRLLREDIRLRTVLQADLVPTYADPAQIEQVVVNLAVNARDAMPQGGELRVETANVQLDEAYAAAHPDARPGLYASIAVADTGCGM
ncbi:MAG: two-component system sensor histidine kinase NtrB, partial [Planctomycetota bacterium]